MSNGNAARVPTAGMVDMKLEVIVLPVSDVDQSKRFYGSLGWRLDADFRNGDHWRGVQFTPPGSQCSIHFGKGLTDATPGSAKGLYLVVDDVEAARAELMGHGVEVSDTFHFAEIGGSPLPGPDPERRTYNSFATFSDPDGNTWLLQEVTSRQPGRGGLSLDVASLTAFLRETEHRHGDYEAIAPKHHL